MPLHHKFVIICLAIIFILTGSGLIVYVGLPHPADYSGYMLEDIGYVAPEVNYTAPPFTLSTVDMDTIALGDLRGNVVIINFWATWCIPCRIEMQALQDLYESYEQNLHILGVNLGESPQAVAQWVDEFSLTYDILLDPLQSVAQQYQIRGQPSTYLIDRDGIIRELYYGPVTMEELRNSLIALTQS